MADTAEDALRAALAERYGEAPPVPPGLGGLDELLRMAAHATHRDWAARPVGPDLVRLLAACALAAPSKSFLQQADIVEVRDDGRRRAVEALVPAMPWLRAAPALLVFCGNGRRFRRIFARRGVPFANEHLDGFFNPVVDASLVMMNFIRAAEAIGLGCCPISVLRDRAAELAGVLELPAHVVPVAGLAIGWPAGERAISPRFGLDATLHVDRFDDAGIDAAIDAFDARYVEARRRVGAPAGASWSEERVRQYGSAQRADWGAFVRSRGFDPS
jgi:nitroreductase